MVRVLIILNLAFLTLIPGFGQTLNFGFTGVQQIPEFQTEDKTYYLSYLYLGENVELFLKQKESRSLFLPAGYIGFDSKNRFSSILRINPVRSVLIYDVNGDVDLGIRMIALDSDLKIGYNLTRGKIISIIPEIGMLVRVPLSVRDGVHTGTFSTKSTIGSNPNISGVQAGLLTNQTMDFKSVLLFGSAGVRLKWYNFFVGIYYDQNIQPVDNRDFYKKVSQTNIVFGIDLLSFYLIKNQGKNFEN